MTTIESFNRKECEKIDPLDVNAYFEFEIDPENPSVLILHNSWGDISIDLTPIVKAAETVTHLKLSPDDYPHNIDYENEKGCHECISGEDLARILPDDSLIERIEKLEKTIKELKENK